MSYTSQARSLAALAAAMLGLAACGNRSADDATAAPVAPAAGPAAAGPRAADYVRAVVLGDDAGHAAVRFQLEGRPVIGRPLGLYVEVTPAKPLGSARVAFTARSGLELATAVGEGPLAALVPQQPSRFRLSVVPTNEGIGELVATVTTALAGEPERVTEFAMPVIMLPASAVTPAAGGGSPGKASR